MAIYTCVLFVSIAAGANASNFDAQVDKALKTFGSPGVLRSAIGVTRRGTTIPSFLTADAFDYDTKKTRILLVGGLDGSKESVEVVGKAWASFSTHPKLVLSTVPIANPDGWASGKGSSNLAGGRPTEGYPPSGPAYHTAEETEAAHLWRWIGVHAPDLVVDVRFGARIQWRVVNDATEELRKLADQLRASRGLGSSTLAAQLIKQAPAQVGRVPALQVHAPDGRFMKELVDALDASRFNRPSPARQEIQKRIRRTPLEVAIQLAQPYGHELDSVAYQPALSLIARSRLSQLAKDPGYLAEVETIVAPFRDGKKPTLTESPSGGTLAGHLIFTELARRTQNPRYVQLARQAADMGFDGNGLPREAMPFHREMSDAVFMGTPILVHVGRLTGENRYYDMALRHLRFMLKLNLRPDGLHQHSPLDRTAWGRGNGFPALGLALCLTHFPQARPDRDEMVAAHRAHLEALARHQDPSGMWHQVIDHPGSYRELSCTCMITFAMIRGVRLGWLEESTYRPVIEKAWPAILARIAPNGSLIDVCRGTGKQTSLRAYLDRTALLGPDTRGGAMALTVTTEMAAWQSAPP